MTTPSSAPDPSAYENLARSDSFEPLSVETPPNKQERPQAKAQPLLAQALPPDFLSPSADSEFEVIEEIHDLVINRQSGQGLGVSIAGGKGSPPYKGSDEVKS